MIYLASVLIYAEWFRELISGVINSFKHGLYRFDRMKKLLFFKILSNAIFPFE